jgi:hypothetical protein
VEARGSLSAVVAQGAAAGSTREVNG